MKYLGVLFALICFVLPVQAQSNCKVLDSDIAGSYTGGCKDGLAHGKGTAKGKDSYEGEFIAGWPHGKGTYKWSGGNNYTGDWQQGQHHGTGTKKWAAGGVYTGKWEKHKQTCGRYVYPDGDVYEGCYQADGVTPARRTQRQMASEKRRSTCQHLYQGRVFKRDNFFGHLNYIVIGFSPNQGRATVKAEHDGSLSEVACTDIPD